MHACMHMYVHAYMHARDIDLHTYITYTHKHIHVYINAYLHTYVNTYTHAHVQTFIQYNTMQYKTRQDNTIHTCMHTYNA